MARSNKSTFVKIQSTTLNALKQMLFSSEGGVDLTPIVKDLAVGSNSEDLTAINVALAYKGVKPEIDTTPRFDDVWEHRGTFHRYDVEDYSLIRDIVKCRITTLFLTEDGKFEVQSEDVTTMLYERFLELSDSCDSYVERITKYRSEHPQK